MSNPSSLLALAALGLVLGASACSGNTLDGGSSKTDGTAGPPVIESVDPANGASGEQRADGNYTLKLNVSAHDDGTIVSARIDFSSAEPPSIVGREVEVKQQKLSSYPIEFEIARAAGPGTGDANLVLTDDKGSVSKKKIVVKLDGF